MPKRLLSDAQQARLCRWWACMFDDREIASRLGVHTWNVRACRKRLGLTSWYATKLGRSHSPATRAKLSASFRRRLEAAGVRSIVQLSLRPRGERQRQALAGSYGLPEDLYPVQVQVLLALTGGPMTLWELVAALGKCRKCKAALHVFAYRAVAGGNYVADLLRRGLIVRAPTNRGPGHGSGAGPGLYMLTPLSMDLLSQSKGEDAHADPVS